MLNTKGDCLQIKTPGGGVWGLPMEQENPQGDVVEFVKEWANWGSVAEWEAVMRV
jgi:N-methylhydantoinase B/oxoprolinase/acetone carboxylase alpha subunit